MYDIIFISYDELNAKVNLDHLKKRFPFVKHVSEVKGIHRAHIEAANRSCTSMFWVVDADAIILDNFDFTYKVTSSEQDIVHVWRSKNPVNGLEYGYGGVKLLPRKLTLAMDTTSTDMTMNISNRFKVMDEVSNITAFNTDPFNTWKSAFRECVKLSSKINNHIDDESLYRLKIWCTVGDNNPYGEYSIAGALAGNEYGYKYKDDKIMLSKINDWKWLEDEFRKY